MARLLRPGWLALALVLLACAAIRFALGSQFTGEPSSDLAGRLAAPQMSASPPPQLSPTGGPYLETARVMDLALSESAHRRVADARLESVLFLRYADAVRRIGSGSVPYMSPDREVYLVTISGDVSVSRHGQPAGLFARSFCVFDASTGDLVVWGASNRPDTGETVERRSPAQN